jgi:hypothetical protein
MQDDVVTQSKPINPLFAIISPIVLYFNSEVVTKHAYCKFKRHTMLLQIAESLLCIPLEKNIIRHIIYTASQ